MKKERVRYRELTMFDIAFTSMTFPSFQHLVGMGKKGDSHIISLGAFYENNPAGLVLCTVTENEAQLQSIYIAAEYRNNGLAFDLILKLISILKKWEIYWIL